jgi:phosphoribosyl-ATP pyrophosphohydrolase
MSDPRIIRLEQTIRDRAASGSGNSYVASLFAKGREKIAQKVGEEATETVIAAVTGDADQLTSEAADLVFHLLVLLAEAGQSFDDVLDKLAQREGMSGLDEKASRREP